MNCLELRRAIAVDPADANPELAAHRAECSRCAAAFEEAQQFERELQAALAIEVPEGLAEKILLRQTTEVSRERRGFGRRRALQWAAGFVFALGVGALWQQKQVQAMPFGEEAAKHVQGESFSLTSWAKVSPAAVDAAFAESGIELAAAPDDVNYLVRCPMAGQTIVHMVTQRAEGPVTVMYLPKRERRAPAEFRHEGLKGRTAQVGPGTLVLVASDTTSFDAIVTQWQGVLGADGVAFGSP
jgi:hypothetical protein